MEEELGCPMYLAIILSEPKLKNEGDLVRFRARFHGKTRAFMVESTDKKLLECHRGDEVWLAGDGEETGKIVRHNRFIRWLMQMCY